MKLEIVVLYTEATKPALNRTLKSLPDGAYVTSWPVSDATDKDTIRKVVDGSTADWVMVIRPSDFVPPVPHASREVAHKFMPPHAIRVWTDEATGLPWHKQAFVVSDARPLHEVVAALPPGVDTACSVYFWAEDSAGDLSRTISREAWLVRRGARFRVTTFGFFAEEGMMALLVNHPFLRQPMSAFLHEQGRYPEAVEAAAVSLRESDAAKSRDADGVGLHVRAMIDKKYFVAARAEVEAREAEAAFRVLFRHMSLSEELWRLRELMRYLPYTFEDRVEDLRTLLQKQIGHLGGGEEAWYRDGSPAEIIDGTYVEAVRRDPTQRVLWLIEECRKQGFRRVVELGSVDGVNLFAYQQLASEIEWHGVEVNPKGKLHADALCAQLGMPKLNMHTASFGDFAYQQPGYKGFDAAAVFEVLEHNFDPNPILDAAEACVRPGGRVYITTPNGNWSAHDEKTRELELRKDHVRAYTVKRMRDTLDTRGAKNINIFSVGNVCFWEANSFVFASYEVA